MFHHKEVEKHPDQKMISLNTQNILFISGGLLMGYKNIYQKD